ncbi:hypothetical protein [Polaromonas sp. CG_9.11]|uniref:hypothetical protein n=1 Tax=Polaromonas sp. CG_9.11 TaxID=2787730 RepID=UPI0018C9B90D|nr:hypothetical protein [Polaromonas sp. CG_9.11]MBG6075009.1 hypothetical protein [Polaromonas sp. CG_9.11]
MSGTTINAAIRLLAKSGPGFFEQLSPDFQVDPAQVENFIPCSLSQFWQQVQASLLGRDALRACIRHARVAPAHQVGNVESGSTHCISKACRYVVASPCRATALSAASRLISE